MLAVCIVLGLAACGGRDASGPGADAETDASVATDAGAAGDDASAAPTDAAAGGDAAAGHDASAGDAAGVACTVPSGADTFDDASDHGCFPTSGEMVNGANACMPDEYGTTCLLGSVSGPIPVPAGALGCRVVPIPTPLGVTFFCCPCGPDVATPDAMPNAAHDASSVADAAEDAPESGDAGALSCGHMGDPCGPGTRCGNCLPPLGCTGNRTCEDVGPN